MSPADASAQFSTLEHNLADLTACGVQWTAFVVLASTVLWSLA